MYLEVKRLNADKKSMIITPVEKNGKPGAERPERKNDKAGAITGKACDEEKETG